MNSNMYFLRGKSFHINNNHLLQQMRHVCPYNYPLQREKLAPVPQADVYATPVKQIITLITLNFIKFHEQQLYMKTNKIHIVEKEIER